MDEPVSPPPGEPRDPYAPPPADHRPPAGPPAPRPPAPQRTAHSVRANALGWRAVAIGVLGLAVGALLWPLAVIGVALCLVGAWSGLRARRWARRGGGRATAATIAVVVGLAGTLVTGALTVFSYAFHAELSRYQECQSGANTTTAKQLCEQRLRDEIAVHSGIRLP